MFTSRNSSAAGAEHDKAKLSSSGKAAVTLVTVGALGLGGCTIPTDRGNSPDQAETSAKEVRPTATEQPTTKDAEESDAYKARQQLADVVERVEKSTRSKIGVAVGVQNGDRKGSRSKVDDGSGGLSIINVAGSLGFDPSPAWSTIKVPLAIAALRKFPDDPEVRDAARIAITQSDNQAADDLWRRLGGGLNAAEAIRDVLWQARDPQTTVQVEATRPGLSPYGQMWWGLEAQARFAGALATATPGGKSGRSGGKSSTGSGQGGGIRAHADDAGAGKKQLEQSYPHGWKRSKLKRDAAVDAVIAAMDNISPEQSYGLGQLKGTKFKGGWGPDEEGDYEVRQFGFTPNKVPIAVIAKPIDGTYESGQEALNELVKELVREGLIRE